MTKMKLMLVAVCLLSASVASAAITYGTIDFESALTGANYAALDSTSNLALDAGVGKWISHSNNTIVINFDQAVRMTSIDLGYKAGWTAPYMNVYGINGVSETLIISPASRVDGSTYALDGNAYEGLKITQTTYYGRIDNLVYEFGVVDPEPEPEPNPVPAPGAIVLAGIGTCVASWIRKRKMA